MIAMHMPAPPEMPLYRGVEREKVNFATEFGHRKVGSLNIFTCTLEEYPATLVVTPGSGQGLVNLWRLWSRADREDEELKNLVDTRPPFIIYREGGGQVGSTDPRDAVATFLCFHVPTPSELVLGLEGCGFTRDLRYGAVRHLFYLAQQYGLIDAKAVDRAAKTYLDGDWNAVR